MEAQNKIHELKGQMNIARHHPPDKLGHHLQVSRSVALLSHAAPAISPVMDIVWASVGERILLLRKEWLDARNGWTALWTNCLVSVVFKAGLFKDQ